MMSWGNYGWGMGFGWFFMIILGVLIIAGFLYIVQAITSRYMRTDANETPIDILKKRFAKGEISKEDFERMKDDIMKS